MADPLGRVAGELDVSADAGLWRSRRHGTCRFDPASSIVLAGVGLTVPARDFPEILLGRLPSTARDPGGAALPVNGQVERRDSAGGLWRIVLRSGAPIAWTLVRAGVSDLSWRELHDGGRLAASDGSLKLEWRDAASEPLRTAAPEFHAEPGAPVCDDADVS